MPETNARRMLEPAQETPGQAAAAPGFALEDQVGHLLRRAFQRHTALFAAGIRPPGLTPTQFATLFKLSELGALSQNHLGRLAAMDAATMMGVIRRLLDRRYIVRRPDPSHGRRVLLALTPEGEAVVRTAVERACAVTRETLSPLEPDEQATLLRLLRRIT